MSASLEFVSKQPAPGAALRHLEIQAAAISVHAARYQMFDLLGGQFTVATRHHAPGARLSLHTLRREIWRDKMELTGTPNLPQVAYITGVHVRNWGWLKFSETSFWRRA